MYNADAAKVSEHHNVRLKKSKNHMKAVSDGVGHESNQNKTKYKL